MNRIKIKIKINFTNGAQPHILDDFTVQCTLLKPINELNK